MDVGGEDHILEPLVAAEENRAAAHSHATRGDLKESEEHVDALEDAIEWCVHNKAIVNFGEYVYIKVRRGNRAIMHGAPAFLQAVEDIAEGKI